MIKEKIIYLFIFTFLLFSSANFLSAQVQNTSDFEFSKDYSIGDIYIDKDIFNKGESISVSVDIISPEVIINLNEEEAFDKYVTQDSEGNYVIIADADSFDELVKDTDISVLESSLDDFDYRQSGLPYLNISVLDSKGVEVYVADNLEIAGITRQISFNMNNSYKGLSIKADLVLDDLVIDSKEEYFANNSYEYVNDYKYLVYKILIPLLILIIIILLFIRFKKKHRELSV